MTKQNIFKLAVTLALSAVGAAQAQDLLYLNDSECSVLVRKKFTRAWQSLPRGLDRGTGIKVLGRTGDGSRATLIFDVVRPYSEKRKSFEFKASESCFTTTRIALSPQKRSYRESPPSPSGRWQKAFRLHGSYLQEEISFIDAATQNADNVVATHYGFDLGLGVEKARRWQTYGATFYLGASKVSGTAPAPLFNTFNGSAFAATFGIEPYYLYPLSPQFLLGIGANMLAHYTFWAAATTGSIDKKITFYVAGLVKARILMGDSELGFDGGLGVLSKKLYFAAHYGFKY